ncbi:MAG: GNAT family N-acetyltransferase [Theionarchaea archaeon]|nr:GNAT family N-acetyltransferase [Theionarchaea archaeon]MBU7037089.1 GNAT family N-acetyltransferase [Theionarchaea archaeon]
MYKGTKVSLQSLERKHLQKCVEWLNDPEITETLSMSEPVSMESEQRWYDSYLKDDHSKILAIETVKGEFIGNIGLHNIDLHNRKAELGIFIGDKEYWGKGYGTEAVLLGLKFAFEALNLNKVYLRTFVSNKRAQRCYEKAGFKKEGILRQDMFKNGNYVDCIVYSVLIEEYFRSIATG